MNSKVGLTFEQSRRGEKKNKGKKIESLRFENYE